LKLLITEHYSFTLTSSLC